MLKFTDLADNRKYRNKKNKKIYTLKKIGLHTESEEEIFAYYEDENGFPWFRPLGLFMRKFENIAASHENKIIHTLCQKFGYTPFTAQTLLDKYDIIIDMLLDNADEEKIAEKIEFADSNHLSASEWEVSIKNVNKVLKDDNE